MFRVGKTGELDNESVADLTFSTEHLFALNIVTLGNIVDKYLDGGNNSFALEESRLSEYYGSSYDYRYLYLFKTGVGMSNTLRYLKNMTSWNLFLGHRVIVTNCL